MVALVFQTLGTLNSLKVLKYTTAREVVISETDVENIDWDIVLTVLDCTSN